jgi:hypothetical protein
MKLENGKAKVSLIDQDASIPSGFDRSISARDPNLADKDGKPVDRRHYIRDMPPTITKDLADGFRKLQAQFPQEKLREWISQAEVDGLVARLAVVVEQLDSGAIKVVAGPVQGAR